MPVTPFREKRAQPKPPLGSSVRARKAKRSAIETEREKNKRKAKVRDGFKCRWPGCDCHALKLRLEIAHILPISRGGSDQTENLVTLCFEKHRGQPSLHSGDLKIVKVTSAGADGTLDFLVKHETFNARLQGGFVFIGSNEPGRRG